jgi:O-antigen ligase
MILIAMISGTVLSVMTRQLIFIGLGPLFLIAWAGMQEIRFVYFLLLFTIPFSAEIQITDALGTDFPDEPLMWFLSMLILLHFMVYRKRSAAIPVHPIIFLILLFHLIWITFSSVLSQHVILSFKYLAAKLWYVLALAAGSWYCLRDRRDIMLAASILTGSMTAAILYVLSKHALSGFTFETSNLSVEPFFRNHVNYGALLVCLLPLPVAGHILFPEYRRMFEGVILLWLAALFFSYSRGAWLAALTGLLTVIAMRKKILHWAAGAGIALLLSVAVFFMQDNRYLEFSPNFERTIYHGDFRQHLQATYKMTDISSMERFYRWIAAVRMVSGNELHGFGPNSFYQEYRPYAVRSFQTYVSDNPERSTVHNYFLLLLVEQGIPGLVIFSSFLAILLWVAYRWYHHAEDKEEKAIACCISAIIVMVIALNMLSDLIETDKIGSIFFICTGILLRHAGKMPLKPANR